MKRMLAKLYWQFYKTLCWATVDEACEIKKLPAYKKAARMILPAPTYKKDRERARWKTRPVDR